jgi:UDP-2,3-diacylglucosamine pyrophosphatase LpxH
MRDMDTDVVYVAGNHDEDIAELIDSCDHDKKELAKERIKMRQQMESEHPGEKPLVGCSPRALGVLRSVEKDGTERPESLKVAWGESPDGDPRTFEICNRHYPGHRVDKGAEGLNVGGIDYAFVHGQQFDKEQITYSISQAIGRRVDPVDFLQDLASISVTRNMKDRIQWVNGGLAIVLLMILVKPEFLQVLPGQIFSWGVMVFGAITGFLLALMFLYGIYLFGYARCGPDRVASADILIKICVIGFVVCALLLVMGLMGLLEGVKTGVVASGILWGFFLLLLVASLYMLGVMTFPVLFAWAKRKVYNGFLNIRNMSSNAVLTEKFDATTYTFKTKVLIFGHTHQPDFTKPEKDDKFRLLINTGTWVDEHPDRETKKCDTFVYIDKNGVCCLRWNDRKRKIECFCKDMEDGPKPLCRFLEDNKILLKDPPGSSP